MKRKSKIFFAIIALILTIYAQNANAEISVTPGSGGTGSHGGCTECSYVYDSSWFGVRLSLYKYDDNKNLTFIDSKDLVNSIPHKVINTTEKQYGRYSYTKLKKTLDFGKCEIGKTCELDIELISKYKFPDITGKSGWGIDLAKKIQKYFGATDDVTIAKIKEMYGVTVSLSELPKYYLVAEPTIFYYNRPYNFYTYATGYEYMRVLDKLNDYDGSYAYNLWVAQGNATIRGYLFNGMYNAANTSKFYAPDIYTDGRYDRFNFLSHNNNTSLIKTKSSVIPEGSQNEIKKGYTRVNYEYGAMIFWIGESGCTTKTCGAPCKTECAGLSGDALLKCGEKYCSTAEGVTNSTTKAKCLKDDCGYKYTPLSCSGATDKKAKKTVCDSNTDASKTTCFIIPESNYQYKEECTVTSNIAYPALPKDVHPGEGFEYKVLFGGNKKCTLTFDTETWKFQYASAWSDAERKAYVDATTAFFNKKVAETDTYRYDSKTATIEVQIDEKKNGNDIGQTQKLIYEDKYENGDLKIRVSKEANVTYSFHNNSKTAIYDVSTFKTESTNAVFYTLPNVCVSSKDNETVYKKTTCGNDKGPYNKYFTNKYSDIGTNDTKTTVTHAASGMEDANIAENECEYKVSKKKLSCYITIEPGSVCNKVLVNNVDINFKLNYMYDGREPKIYLNINEKGYEKNINKFNNKNTHTIPKNSVTTTKKVKVYGTVSDGIDYATCYTELTIQPSNYRCEWIKTENGENITLKLKEISDSNAVYKIKFSSSNNWLKQKSLTFSKDSDVTINGRIETSTGVVYTCEFTNKCSKQCTSTCKNNKQCAKNHCEKYWQVDIDNYSDFESCYDSCTKTSCQKEFEGDKCKNIDAIRKYCKDNYNKPNNYYESVATCINDCACGGEPGENDYYYRTIENDNPFPQRDANANWLGFEGYITNDVDDKTSSTIGLPEYEIVLDEGRMQKIIENSNSYNAKNGNDVYNDYIWKDDKPKNGSAYKSKFIHNDDISTGGFKSYFTYIAGQKTS